MNLGALVLLPVVLLLALPKARPTATPTPVRKLSGGFGRPPAEPEGKLPDPERSLGDTARAARRTPRSRTSIAIRNSTLVKDPKKNRPATPTTSAPASVTPLPSSASGEPGTPGEGESYWREKMRATRQRVAKLKELAEELEGQVGKLQDDFYSWDDGQYRDAVIKPALDKKREELETVRRALIGAEKDLAELPERARKSGALPGWLREQ